MQFPTVNIQSQSTAQPLSSSPVKEKNRINFSALTSVSVPGERIDFGKKKRVS